MSTAKNPEQPFHLRIDGVCPICGPAIFEANHPYLRGSLICKGCQSRPRERALALVLIEILPNWRDLDVHESSPADRGISAKLRREARKYVGSHYYPDVAFGEVVEGHRNENLECQTFPDEVFDLVVSLDVHEHLFNPGAAYREVHRTLKPGGLYIHTFPIERTQVPAAKRRASLEEGEVVHHEPPQYHGNPIGDGKVLVTWNFGYDIHEQIAAWAPFNVSITRFHNQSAGVLGAYTEVVVCKKA